MYAVITIPGRQVKAEPGQKVRIDFMDKAKTGDKIVFDKVLLLADGPNIRVGTPYVGATVNATVISQDRGKKVIVFKKKKRVDYHKRQGHRQRYTTVVIDSIVG
jgi:large subunit ribosomal protein L21